VPPEKSPVADAPESTTAAPGVAAQPATRRSLTAARRASSRRRGIAVGALAAAALVVGSGFAVATTTSGPTAATASATDQADREQAVADALREAQAKSTLQIANQVLAHAEGKVDASALATSVASLADYERLDGDRLDALLAETVTASQGVQTASSQKDAADRAAAAQAAAEQAAAEQAAAAQAAAEAAAAQAAAEAAALAQTNTPEGAKAAARSIAASKYGWGESQMSCLTQLWQKESGWNYQAVNKGSGATGIPQSLPGSKMASAGSDWATNATTQVTWGLDYIQRAYGTPCSAWSHSQAVNWY